MANHNKFIISDIYRRPAYWFGHPNTGVKKTFFKFSFFQLYFNKKYVEVAITMHLIILKCLRKCRQKRNTMRQRDRSKRRNCRQRCFHSFNFINHASIRFFVSVNSLHFFLTLSVLLAASFKLRLVSGSHKLITIQIFSLNI